MSVWARSPWVLPRFAWINLACPAGSWLRCHLPWGHPGPPPPPQDRFLQTLQELAPSLTDLAVSPVQSLSCSLSLVQTRALGTELRGQRLEETGEAWADSRQGCLPGEAVQRQGQVRWDAETPWAGIAASGQVRGAGGKALAPARSGCAPTANL